MGQIFFEAGWCLPHECNLMYLAHDFINGWGVGGGGGALTPNFAVLVPCVHSLKTRVSVANVLERGRVDSYVKSPLSLSYMPALTICAAAT